ncbi:hypothetical protein PS1_038184 [Malus domestica]
MMKFAEPQMAVENAKALEVSIDRGQNQSSEAQAVCFDSELKNFVIGFEVQAGNQIESASCISIAIWLQENILSKKYKRYVWL